MKRPYCIWITGMPNSGKSTIAYYLLQNKLRHCVVIDGDKFRETVNPELTFSREDIIENNRTAIKVIKQLMSMGFNVIVAMITPYEEIREMADEEANKKIRKELDIRIKSAEKDVEEKYQTLSKSYDFGATPDDDYAKELMATYHETFPKN